MVGKTISHYRILEKLGRGRDGVVYKAQDARLNRPVALKFLPPDKVADPERRRRFVQEARTASALNHPNIVTSTTSVRPKASIFIAMEYVAGKTLAQLISVQRPPLDRALKCAVQIADALRRPRLRDHPSRSQARQRHGHRRWLREGAGLRPGEAREPVSDEFASTRTLLAETKEGVVAGTAAYMSPEQAEAKPVDARSDIFSFGALLYETVSGRRPFSGTPPSRPWPRFCARNPRRCRMCPRKSRPSSSSACARGPRSATRALGS